MICPVCHKSEMKRSERFYDKDDGSINVELTCCISTCDTKFIGTLYQTVKDGS